MNNERYGPAGGWLRRIVRPDEENDAEKGVSATRRRETLTELFLNYWLSEAPRTLAEQTGIEKEAILEDLASNEFREMLAKKLNIVINDARYYCFDYLREPLLSRIRLAADSGGAPTDALTETIQAIRHYVGAVFESVLLEVRTQVETWLYSQNRAPTGELCEKCGAPMRVVETSWGSPFAGCSRYPECENAKSLTTKALSAVPRMGDVLSESDKEDLFKRRLPSHLKFRLETYDEVQTRVDFIDPLLRSLGWDVFHRTNAQTEVKCGGFKIDYVLFGAQRTPFAAVEAKKLNSGLREHESQLFKYMEALCVKTGVLTNGLAWRVYQLQDGADYKRRLNIADIVWASETRLNKLVNLLTPRSE